MMMALLTAAGAMSLAPGDAPTGRALWLILGTALIVGAANTLNMWLERDIDCLMARTRRRPLPMHRLTPRTALVFGAVQGALASPSATPATCASYARTPANASAGARSST